MITQKELHEILFYDKETGFFYWKKPKQGRVVGKLTGTIKKNGYIYIQINRKIFSAHRLAWLYCYGDLDNKNIDHINNIRTDNRIANLRLATKTENCWNAKISTTNTSGVKGVDFFKKQNKWRARLRVNYKEIHVGYFSSLEEAKNAIIFARKKFHKDYANHG